MEQKILYLNHISPEIKSGGSMIETRNLTILAKNFDIDPIGIYHQPKSTLQKLIDFITSPIPYMYSLKEYLAIKKRISVSDADILYVEGSYYGRLYKYAKKKNFKIITYVQNCEYHLFKELYRYPFLYSIKKSEKHVAKYSDEIIFLNTRDSQMFNDYYGTIKSFTHIPITIANSVSKEELVSTDHLNHTPYQILFVGSYFRPNELAVKYIIDFLADRINADFNIVGYQFEKFNYIKKKNVKIVGSVDDLSLHYLNSDLIISPIFEGSGMKVKTCEALMYGKKIFGTDEAFEGYEISDIKSCIRCNTADEFVQKINDYIQNSHHSFDSKSRELWLTKYQDSLAEKLLTETVKHI